MYQLPFTQGVFYTFPRINNSYFRKQHQTIGVHRRHGLYSLWGINWYNNNNNALSPLCRVFTSTYLTQTMCLGYIVLHLFPVYSLCYMKCYFPCYMFCTFPLILPAVCVQCPVWLFFCSSFILCFPGMLLRYFVKGSSCPYYYWYHFCLYIPHALYFCCRILIL